MKAIEPICKFQSGPLPFISLLAVLLVGVTPGLADILYVANYTGNTIEKYDSVTGAHLGTFAHLESPEGLAFDRAGNLYAIGWNRLIMKYTPDGIGSVFGSSISGGGLFGLAFDHMGNLYVDDTDNSTIMRFTPAGVGSIFVSTGLNYPLGLAFDSADNLYVANLYGNNIEKFTPAGVGSVFVNNFTAPLSLAFDGTGNLYAASGWTSRALYKITPSGAYSPFVAGLPGEGGLAFDSQGNLFISLTGNFPEPSSIMKYTPGGVGSLFTTDPNELAAITIIPEPFPLGLLGLGLSAFLAVHRAPPLSLNRGRKS